VLNKVEPGDGVVFASRSGPLPVTRQGDRLVLDFPSNPPRATMFPEHMERILGKQVREVLATKDHLVCVLDNAAAVAGLTPDLAGIASLPKWSLIVTAPGEGEVDFVSRFFAPKEGLAEDPVTGSAHCVLTPFWAKRLGKKVLVARQLSKRGGTLFVEECGDRVHIGGTVVPYLEGWVEV
jgi:predicted PhzF superfamily epimerase YddE/YHI9